MAFPVPSDEEARLEALLSYDILDSEEEQIFDDLTALASEICKTPIALVSLVDKDRQWFKSKVGLSAQETHRNLAFCGHTILDNKILIIPDATKDRRFCKNPLVTDNPNIRLYAGAPLINPEGYRLGTLCVIDDRPRNLSKDQLIILEMLARQVSSQLELRRKVRELKDTQVKVLELKDKAEAANKMKSAFLANMSHEIRTPMTAIIGFSESLMEASITSEQRMEFGRIVVDNGHFLLQIINDILDLSKIEAGKLKVENVKLDPHQLFQSVYDLMIIRAKEKNIQLGIEVLTPLPTEIQSDPIRLRQILVNFIGNAVKFTPENGTINLFVAYDPETDRGESQLTISVLDTGIGIVEEKIEEILEPFTQEDLSTTREYGGTGLGLTISKKLVELLGGNMDVWSEKGRGAAFKITIPTGSGNPFPTVTEVLNSNQKNPKLLQEVKFPDLSHANLLIAEDNKVNQKLLIQILKKSKITPKLVENGEEAIKTALEAKNKGEPFDVILMDMQMPILDGYKASASLRDQGYEQPIIAVTAHALATDKEKCLEAGCNDFTTKPLQAITLVKLIEKYCAQG